MLPLRRGMKKKCVQMVKILKLTWLYLSIIQLHYALHSMEDYSVPFSHTFQTKYLTHSTLTLSLSSEISFFGGRDGGRGVKTLTVSSVEW
jgi:hypothetical protein